MQIKLRWIRELKSQHLLNSKAPHVLPCLSRSTQVWRTNCKQMYFSLPFFPENNSTELTQRSPASRTLLRFPRWIPSCISFTFLVKPRFADTWFLSCWALHTSQAHTSCCTLFLLERVLKASARKEPLQSPEVHNWPSRGGWMSGFSGVWLHIHYHCKYSQQGQFGTWEVPFIFLIYFYKTSRNSDFLKPHYPTPSSWGCPAGSQFVPHVMLQGASHNQIISSDVWRQDLQWQKKHLLKTNSQAGSNLSLPTSASTFNCF